MLMFAAFGFGMLLSIHSHTHARTRTHTNRYHVTQTHMLPLTFLKLLSLLCSTFGPPQTAPTTCPFNANALQ